MARSILINDIPNDMFKTANKAACRKPRHRGETNSHTDISVAELSVPWLFSKPEFLHMSAAAAAAAAADAAAKSLQSCPTLCDPIDGSPPGSPVPGILQARTLEWLAISFSNAWTWKVKVKSLSPVRLLATPWTTAHQAPLSMGFARQEYWSGLPLPSPVRCSGVQRKYCQNMSQQQNPVILISIKFPLSEVLRMCSQSCEVVLPKAVTSRLGKRFWDWESVACVQLHSTSHHGWFSVLKGPGFPSVGLGAVYVLGNCPLNKKAWLPEDRGLKSLFFNLSKTEKQQKVTV